MKSAIFSLSMLSMLSVINGTLGAYISPREQYELERAILNVNPDKVAQGLKDLDRAGVSPQEKKNLVGFLLELSAARIKKGDFAWQTDETVSFVRLVLGGLVGAGALKWAVSPSGRIKVDTDCAPGNRCCPHFYSYGPSKFGRLVSLGVSMASFYQAYQGQRNLDKAEKESIKPAMAIRELLESALKFLDQ